MKPLCLIALLAARALGAGQMPVRPEPRSRAEVARILAASTPAPAPAGVWHILLVAGPKDHGKGQHDYPKWQHDWSELLPQAKGVEVRTAFPWAKPEDWDWADVAVLYLHAPWTGAQLADVARLQARGGGVVLMHWAIGSDQTTLALAERVGLAYPSTKYRHGVVDLHLAPGDPITQGFPPVMRFTDEVYWPIEGDRSKVHVIGYSQEKLEGDTERALPVFWTYEPGRGRAFVSIFGHFTWTLNDPCCRLLLLRGICWAGRQPVSGLDALALVGADVR